MTENTLTQRRKEKQMTETGLRKSSLMHASRFTLFLGLDFLNLFIKLH